MADLHQRYLLWEDREGRTRLTSYYTDTDSDDIMTSMVAISRAVVGRWVAGAVFQEEPIGAAGQFQPVDDALRLVFADDYGEEVSIFIPAPKEELFQADSITADPAALTSLFAQVLDSLLTRSGYPVTRYVKGYRTQRATRS